MRLMLLVHIRINIHNGCARLFRESNQPNNNRTDYVAATMTIKLLQIVDFLPTTLNLQLDNSSHAEVILYL